MTEEKYLVALGAFYPFGPVRINLLRKYFKKTKQIWKADKNRLLEVGLKPSVVRKFINYRKKFDFDSFFAGLDKLKIDYITIDSDKYPVNLKKLEDAPTVLFVKGKLDASDVNSVAIVGSRKMTSYGKEVTERFAGELTQVGVTIVSGLAFGVDVVALRTAVETGGRSIAVLASGLDSITPRSNEWLGRKIVNSGGALVSEYPPGTDVLKAFFPYRNRIISGLSKAVIVVEGMEKSGTLHTASHAAKQGREVFAVPGQITSPMSGAPHFLIKNGARLATDANDILEELDMQLKVDRDAMEKVLPADEVEKKLLKTLENEEMHIDEIARTQKIDVNVVTSKLTMMELKGLVKNVGDGVYRIS